MSLMEVINRCLEKKVKVMGQVSKISQTQICINVPYCNTDPLLRCT